MDFGRKILNFIVHFFAWFLAIAAVAMFFAPFFLPRLDLSFNFLEYASFVGGTAGPLGALAGFLFVYIAFRSQQNHMDQERMHFRIQSFDATFHKLLGYHKDLTRHIEVNLDETPLTIDALKDHMMMRFRQQMFYGWGNEEENGDNSSPSESEINLTDIREFFFNTYYHQLPSINKLFSSALSLFVHLQNVQTQDSDRYYDILLGQISEQEKFIYFYYFITLYYNLSPIEITQTKIFLRKIKPSILFLPNHIDWLNDIPVE